jgi:Transposase DDE domain group 1
MRVFAASARTSTRAPRPRPRRGRDPHQKEHRLGHFPSHDYGLNRAWLDTAMTACILLSWLKFLALDGDLARAEPRTLRYRVLHAAGRLVRGGRRGTLKIAATWPWAEEIVAAWRRVQAIPHPT